MKELIILRGLPGSGKTTLAKVIGGILCAADDYFDGKHGYVFDPSKLPQAHQACQQRAAVAAAAGMTPIVVHNTASQRWEIRPYARIAEAYGYRLHVVTVEGDHGSVHDVPAATVERMRAQWERWPQ